MFKLPPLSILQSFAAGAFLVFFIGDTMHVWPAGNWPVVDGAVFLCYVIAATVNYKREKSE